MRVLQVNKFLHPFGGAETVLFQTADLLAKHGHEVQFFGMQDARNTVEQENAYFVSNVDYSSQPRLGLSAFGRLASAGRILYSSEAAARMEELLDNGEPDVAHLHNIYHQLSPSILGPLRKHRVPAVMTLHDYKLICPNYTLFAGGSVCERCKGHRYYNAALRRCIKGSRLSGALCGLEAYVHRFAGLYERGISAYLAPSRFMRDKMIEFGLAADRIIHLPNFLNLEDYEPCFSSEPYVVYAGRLERAKGVATLIEAFGRSDLASRFELRIAGDGNLQAELAANCRASRRDNVRLLGRLSRAEMRPLIQNAMFVVIPSEWYENAPMSVLEAYAYGKPVIGARIGGIPELVTEGTTGLLFEPGDPMDLRRAIDRLLANPGLAEEMGRNARRLVEESYGPQTHYERLMEIYADVRRAEPAGRRVFRGGEATP